MNWYSITVVKRDLDLMVGAIRWGGGTVTATRPDGDGVAITYVTPAGPGISAVPAEGR